MGYTVQRRAQVQRGALESLQKSVMEFLGDPGSLFEAHILFPDPLFFLFT